MDGNDLYHVFKIKTKSWYIWLARFVWLAWLIFWVEVALGSLKEREPRAAIISFGILIFSLAIGIFLWSWGRLRPKKKS